MKTVTMTTSAMIELTEIIVKIQGDVRWGIVKELIMFIYVLVSRSFDVCGSEL